MHDNFTLIKVTDEVSYTIYMGKKKPRLNQTLVFIVCKCKESHILVANIHIHCRLRACIEPRPLIRCCCGSTVLAASHAGLHKICAQVTITCRKPLPPLRSTFSFLQTYHAYGIATYLQYTVNTQVARF